MRHPPLLWIASTALLWLLALPGAGIASDDVDPPGTNDCQTAPTDFGDAPEGALAYPGVTGHFPTCMAPTPAGNTNLVCSPVGPVPGSTGFVAHQHLAADFSYWLGCGAAAVAGIDGEGDGKTNDNGGPFSTCNNTLTVDCVEAAFGMNFGQDECYGGVDAGIGAPLVFDQCSPSQFTYRAFYCGTAERQVFLNVLVDWNHDGDWNDEVQCAAGAGCVSEWAIKNLPVVLFGGCNTFTTPLFSSGPAGPCWMRVTLSDNPAPGDFTWNGSAGITGERFRNGETEDYPVVVRIPPPPCPSYSDFGDAPESIKAYPGVPGNFPTCLAPGGVGTFDFDCAPISTPPGPTGYVKHVSAATDQLKFWLGCGDPHSGTLGVDSEDDGKTNDTGAPFSSCSPNVPIDCTDFLGLIWGQDECYGDLDDAGVSSSTPTLIFKTCKNASVSFSTYNCGTQVDAFLNILVDLNEDGDWNDNFQCPGTVGCAYEWAVKNVPIPLGPGCEAHVSPSFLLGPRQGKGWLRITITAAPVGDDFPWNGSAGPSGDGFFRAGETEDYPVAIRPDFVGVDDQPGSDALSFAPLTPNPATGRVLVRFTLPKADQVSIAAYDLAGRKLADLATGRMEAGEHRLDWGFVDARGRQLPAGYYMIKLRVGDRVLTRRGIRVQ